MNLYIIPGALAVTLIVMFVVSLFSKRPLRGLWVFVLVVFLSIWATQIWMSPVGPLLWGLSWLPMFLVAFVMWFLIIMLLPPLPKNVVRSVEEEERTSVIAFGFFFWAVVVLLIIAIVVGMYYVSNIPVRADVEA